MGRKYEQTQQFEAAAEAVWAELAEAVDAAGFRVTETDDQAMSLRGKKRKKEIGVANVVIPGSGVSTATAPARKTWGEKLAASVTTGTNGSTSVWVESRLVFGLIDWGENKKNVDRVLALLKAQLAASQMPLAQPTQRQLPHHNRPGHQPTHMDPQTTPQPTPRIDTGVMR